MDSGASHNFPALNWRKEKGLDIEGGNQFSVQLADEQEVPAIGKVRCLIDLGPMKIALTFYTLDCNVPCVLGIPFLQTTNPTIDWVTHSVQVYTVSGLSSLEVVNNETIPLCEIVSAKQFERGLRKVQYLVDGCFACKADGQFMFTHRHAFGETEGNQPVSQKLTSECLQDLKAQFPQVPSDPKFPIVRNNQVHFEHRIRLKDESAPPPHRKVYPLDQEKLAELKRQITDMLDKNQIRPSDSPNSTPILFDKKKDGHLRFCVDY